MEISEEIRKQVEDGEICVSVCVSAEYFGGGDYTHWQEDDNEWNDKSYEEYSKHLVEEMHEKYDCLRLHSTSELYGIEGGTSFDISYNEFDDLATFWDLVGQYGIEGTLETYPA